MLHIVHNCGVVCVDSGCMKGFIIWSESGCIPVDVSSSYLSFWRRSYQILTVSSSLPVARCPFSCGFQLNPKPSLLCPRSSIWGFTWPVGMLGCLVLSQIITLPSVHIVAIIFGFCGWYRALFTSPLWSIFCTMLNLTSMIGLFLAPPPP